MITSVFGLDPSLTSTGWANSKDQGSVNSKLRGMDRLVEIRDTLRELIPLDAVVFVEGYAMGKQTSHAHAQGELGGVIRVDLHERCIPFVEVPPTSLKKFITGKGNAGKAEVVSMATHLSGIVWKGSAADDMADAWALRQLGCYVLGVSEIEVPKSNTSSLHKIDLSPIEGIELRL